MIESNGPAPPILPYIQLWTFEYVGLLNKPYENEVALRERKILLKCSQPLDFWYAFFKDLFMV